MDRKTELLEATLDFLKKIENSVDPDALRTVVFYDGANCDGNCLMDDIENCLDLAESEKPNERY